METLSFEMQSARKRRLNPDAPPISFAIPTGSGWKLEIVAPLPVAVKAAGEGYAATTHLAAFRIVRRTQREALLALQEHLEWAFIDLSAIPGEELGEADRALLNSLSRYLRLPQQGCGSLGIAERQAFLSYPEEERQVVLDRHSRLFPPAVGEPLDA